MANHVLAVDVGTTNIFAQIYDNNGVLCGQVGRQLPEDRSKANYFEVNPELMWSTFRNVVSDCFHETRVGADRIACLGIAVQRNMLMLWDRSTGEPLTPLISWQDTRAQYDVEAGNKSFSLNALNIISWLIYLITRSTKFKAAAVLRYSVALVAPRLLYLFRTQPELLKRAHCGEVCYGSLESWLLWKLTNGKVHATDYCCASCTGMYDIFSMEWSRIVISGLLRFPMSMLPEVRPTNGHFGDVAASVFGSSFPITALAGDQQAASFAENCFKEGDVKLTLGTGAFLDVNTGGNPYASMSGLYPVIGWQLEGEAHPQYFIEGHMPDCGTAIDWARSIGLYKSVDELSDLAFKLEAEGRPRTVYFVPSFNGMPSPVVDPSAGCLFIGMKANTSVDELVRAVLDGVVFQTRLLIDGFRQEIGSRCIESGRTVIICNGGVSNNDYILQKISQLSGCQLECAVQKEITCLGAARLAALGAGVWSHDHMPEMGRVLGRVFKPSPQGSEEDNLLQQDYKRWLEAVNRAKKWGRVYQL